MSLKSRDFRLYGHYGLSTLWSMIKKIIFSKINSISAAAFLIALSSLASRFLGIFRDHILAGQFGASRALDIYYSAFRIPDFIFNLLILGSLSAGFIPVFAALLKEKGQEGEASDDAWRLVSNIFNILLVAMIVISTLGIIFANPLIKLISPGFTPAEQDLTAQLTRIMFLSPVFLGLSGIVGGVLQSLKRFLAYSLSPVMYNLGIIFGAIFLVPKYGILGLGWGVVIGAFLHFMVQLPTFISLGFRYHPIFNLKNPAARRIGRLMVPRTLSLAVTQINLFTITIMASTMAGGSLAVFNFVNNLQSFPIGIFGISFAVAAFPAFALLAHEKDKLIASISATMRQILFFIIPATAVFLTLRAQIVRIILGSGKFDWTGTVMSIDTLAIFSISLFSQALIPLLVRVFYARHNTKRPFLIGIFVDTFNVGLSWWLGGLWGIRGLALAFSIANIIYLVILWIFLRVELGGLDSRKVIKATFKFIVASTVAALAMQQMKSIVWPFIDMTKVWGVFVQGALAGIVGLAVYFLGCYLLKSEEFFNMYRTLRTRLNWRKVTGEDQGEARGV